MVSRIESVRDRLVAERVGPVRCASSTATYPAIVLDLPVQVISLTSTVSVLVIGSMLA
jgi:hypothetical protein